jgi:hypothetical protein
MNDPALHCRDERRRDDVRTASLHGLDYVEVSDDRQLTLHVWFLGKAPATIRKENVRIRGGRRIRDIRVTDVRVERRADLRLDDSLDVTVDKPGDFSTYTLALVRLDEQGRPTDEPMEGFDPRYDDVDFTFKAGCPSDLDCKTERACPPPERVEPEVNYLAKDYASFRQLILDRLALTMPAWQERHVPDVGITLVELLAYVGDYLSYYQDAVATEAYLGTARLRTSVRRHVRLIDYAMHEGVNARAWVAITTDIDRELPPHSYFMTGYTGAPADRHILTEEDDLANVPAGGYEVFEPLKPGEGQTIQLHRAHNAMHFYTWGDCECCLAPGSTSATLTDAWRPAPEAKLAATEAQTADGPPLTVRALQLQVGDVLIFEEVIGPTTGNPADADPRHRQAVRLTRVTPAVDQLYNAPYGQPIVEIEWAPEDALTFPLCISTLAPPPDCTCMENVSVARGNVILVDHGRPRGETLGTVPTTSTIEGCPTDCSPAEVRIVPGRFRPRLHEPPLTWSRPLPHGGSAAALIAQDPREAVPWIRVESIPPAPSGTGAQWSFDDLGEPTSLAKRLRDPSTPASQLLRARLNESTRQALDTWDGSSPLPGSLRTALVEELTRMIELWSPRRDLMGSGPEDRHFVVEMDDDGNGVLRFGDGDLGKMPAAGAELRAAYRVGNGTAGNVGAEAIAYVVLPFRLSGASIVPRNPLPASGGTEPEPLAEVKLFAPDSFRKERARAITEDDYAKLAERNNRRVQRAAAAQRWTGSWYEALVTIDPSGTEDASQALLTEIAASLEPYRRVGHDLVVAPARYVPLDVELTICVLPHYSRGHVEAALLDVFSNTVLPRGGKGFFHPDNLTFGEGIYASALVAAAQAVPGVQSVEVTKLERYFEGPNDEVRNGALALGPLEIARLDNDPSVPENGRLVLQMRGGR